MIGRCGADIGRSKFENSKCYFKSVTYILIVKWLWSFLEQRVLSNGRIVHGIPSSERVMSSPVRKDVFSDALVDCILHGISILLVGFLAKFPLHFSVVVGIKFSRRMGTH